MSDTVFDPTILLVCVVLYFIVLMIIARITNKNADSNSFFIGNRNSKWYLVAFGMVGASLSGVTFISVPGWVGGNQFAYMQMVLGYVLGYIVVAEVLMPLYYRLNLTSIYEYLNQRFGKYSYKTGALFFLVSRIIGASFRLYLVAMVLEKAVFVPLNLDIPFAATVIITVLLIWIYTKKGGIKTVVWTDTLQTTFMLLAVGMTIYFILNKLDWSLLEAFEKVKDSTYSKWLFTDVNDTKFFIKQFLTGAFITIVMTGLDQDMMQKNLSCKNLKDAKKNMYSFSVVLVLVNFVFLFLGALLFLYADAMGLDIPNKTDYLFPMIALESGLGATIGIFFFLGLIASAYSSADSALTALTTSVCIDLLDVEKKEKLKQERIRKQVHIIMSCILVLVIIVFNEINNDSVIKELFIVAGYTYGPLLGMYAFGMFTKREVNDELVPVIALLSPIISYLLKTNSFYLFNGYQIGFEILMINGLITFLGIWAISKGKVKSIQ